MKTVLLSIILACCETRIFSYNITTTSIPGDIVRPTKIFFNNRKFDAYVPPPSTPVNLFQEKDSVHVKKSHGDIWKWDYWCQMQPVKGNCSKGRDKYFYNTQLAKCSKFKYSGCGGNNNRFNSMMDCQRHCQGAALMGAKKAARTSASCLLQPNPGLCMSIYYRYYYDANIKDCRTFIYGGCGGNGNRFHTKHNCLKTCQEETGDY